MALLYLGQAGAVCASACTLIWSAGLLRMLPPNSKLGFHRIFVRNEADTSVSSARRQIEPAGDLVAQAYRRAGLPSALIARAMETPASDVYWVDAGVSRSQRWERNLNFNPVLLDLAEQECGRETLTSGASKSQFIAWIDCADSIVQCLDFVYPQTSDTFASCLPYLSRLRPSDG